MFKADFIECTAGCHQDSFFGIIQPGRCNCAQTLRGTGNHVGHDACSQDQPAEERRTMITVICCTFQGYFLIHFAGGRGDQSGLTIGEHPKILHLNILWQLKDRLIFFSVLILL